MATVTELERKNPMAIREVVKKATGISASETINMGAHGFPTLTELRPSVVLKPESAPTVAGSAPEVTVYESGPDIGAIVTGNGQAISELLVLARGF